MTYIPDGPVATDRTIVNLDEDYELKYWIDKLGCTENELREAVTQVGSNVALVKYQLRRGN